MNGNNKFVVNRISELMHLVDCGFAKKIKKKNKKYFTTYDAAINCFDDDKIKVKFCSFCRPDKV